MERSRYRNPYTFIVDHMFWNILELILFLYKQAYLFVSFIVMQYAVTCNYSFNNITTL